MSATNDAAVKAYEAYNIMWEQRSFKSDALVDLQFNKEQAQLFFAIDKFFGTVNGFKMNTVTRLDANGSVLINPETKQPCIYQEKDHNAPNVFAKLGEYELMICGGAINGIFSAKGINDLDFYMKNIEKKDAIVAWLSSIFPDDKMTTLNAVTMKRKSGLSRKKWVVQLITRFVGNPADIFEWFDFTITHGAYDFALDTFVFGDRFFQDLSKRRLVYSGASQYPICAMYRTKKYVERGYELPGATIMHIALSIVQLKITNYRELKEQLMGIDTIYLQKLLEAKLPDAPVDYGEFVHEAFQLIDRISGLTMAEEDEDEGS